MRTLAACLIALRAGLIEKVSELDGRDVHALGREPVGVVGGGESGLTRAPTDRGDLDPILMLVINALGGKSVDLDIAK